jgi:hypothetical protein
VIDHEESAKEELRKSIKEEIVSKLSIQLSQNNEWDDRSVKVELIYDGEVISHDYVAILRDDR